VINPKSKLGILSGLAWDKSNQKLWIANGVNLASMTGNNLSHFRQSAAPLFPFSVKPTPSGRGLLVSDILAPDTLHYINAHTLETEASWNGFTRLYESIALPYSDPMKIVVADYGADSVILLEVDPHDKTELGRSVLVSGIGGPVSLVVDPIYHEIVYVTAYDSGKILSIDVTTPGSYSVVASHLSEPEGIDVLPQSDHQHKLVVVEVGRRRLLEVDLHTLNTKEVATDLRVGTYVPKVEYPIVAPPFLISSVAVTDEGDYYISGDETNAIYFIEKKKPRKENVLVYNAK